MSSANGDDDSSPRDAENARRTSPLTRSAVLETAIALVDREGLRQLTMRRLGAECGVEAMSLYHYVHSREDLLAGVVNHLVDRLHDDQLAIRREEDGWQGFLQHLAHGVRKIALEHPELFPLIATRAPEAPWVRPPLRSLRWMETFLKTLSEYGFDDDDAVAAYRSYTTFLLGHLLLEAAVRVADAAPREADQRSPDLSEFPNLHRLRNMLSEDHSRAEFEEALEALLDRLELLTRGR